MPKVSEMRESKFVKQSDVGDGLLVTITNVERYNVAAQGAEPEEKWCLEFRELDKPLVLNSTNIQLCAKICASEDTDDWTGKQVVLYVDPTVSYGGKIIGGIRVRAPKKAAAAKGKPTPQAAAAAEVFGDDDGSPF